MNAGKSTSLIQVAHNYEEHGRKVALYTAAIDHRFGVGVIASRIGPKREAKTFDASLDFFKEMDWKHLSGKSNKAAGQP